MQHHKLRGVRWGKVPGWLLTGGLLTLSPALHAATPGVSIKQYGLDITLDVAHKSISGAVTIKFSRTVAESTAVRLDLANALTVSGVMLDGATVPFTRDMDTLGVPVAPAAGTEHELIISYSGQPNPKRFLFDSDAGGQHIASFGLPYSAKQWWPAFDTPASKAQSADIRITLPDDLIAASNGDLVDVQALPGKLHRYHWHVGHPIYADVISVAAAPYVETDETYKTITGKVMPLTYFSFKEDADKAAAEYAAIPDALHVYEDIFGPYPFGDEKYGVAEMTIPSFREHQTLSSLGRSFITAPRAAAESDDVSTVIAHDLAHQWFGNSLTLKSWSDIWLNESFSNYAVALWHERRDGTADYFKFMRQLDTHDFAGSIYVADDHDLKSMFGSNTFNKGAWVLHMLRHVMGDKAFFAALHAYVADNRYAEVDTASWVAACEKQYGKPLDWFFQEWIYGEGQPALKTVWKQTGEQLSLQLSQIQKGQPFIMPVDVEIQTTTGDARQTVWLRQQEVDLQIPVQGDVKAVVLDPDGWLLKTD